MSHRARKIVQAWLESPRRGVIELARDWRARHPPPLAISGRAKFAALHRMPDYLFGCESGYFVNKKGEIFFFLQLDQYPQLDPAEEAVYLAGDFNGWSEAIGRHTWALVPASLDGQPVLLWSGHAAGFFAHPPMRFKFVTGRGHWLDVPAHAPNVTRDEQGNINRIVEPERTGQHLYQFELAAPLDLSESHSITWADTAGDSAQSVPLRPGDFFYELHSDLPLGAIVRSGVTTFRLFAPRAKSVHLYLCPDQASASTPHRYALKRHLQSESVPATLRTNSGVWEVTLDQNLHGWLYWYQIDGPSDAFGLFLPERRILDPYAIAAVGPEGPGIVLDRAQLPRPDRGFTTPAWQDLIIVEAHVRDLAMHAPIRATAEERRGFAGLRKWVESPNFYLHHLGVNCVELQPVQQFDRPPSGEYHWGYMTTNYFAPESSYSLAPAQASGVRELQDLVRAFHRRGMAVLLDVVFNHVGEPAHLMFVDKLYYFEVERDGALSNWSGCGNDLRARSAMAKRLIIDACTHLLETYGVDGFRFDLAELLGVEVLREIETALKRVKPDVILIAEPWSFRGHIAGALVSSGWASWNDGYRNFLRDFVRGNGTREGFEYFLKGSPWYFARWPAQTVNYTESHDDRTWMDVITENGDGSGHTPTINDRRRTHLMAAILFSSIGIPMLSAGQDFLRSKHGVNNTYLRGDLNALDYLRIYRFPATHAYFADWIAFRRSKAGRLFRQFSRPSEKFFRFWFANESTASVVLYNADRSQDNVRLLLAINATLNDERVAIDPELAGESWRQIADHERFFDSSETATAQPVTAEIFVPALGCGLWISES